MSMELYFELLKKPVFTMDDVNEYYGKIESARSAIKRLMAKGMVEKIRNNLYTCVSGETNAPLANRYQIASAITPTAYVSHHTAMEYYGANDQMYYDVYVSSKTEFKDFEFDGYTYHYVPCKCNEGIESVAYSGGVRVTDRERTVVDSIKEMDKIAGIEEVISNIECMPRLNEKRLLAYLECYQNKFLYQKAGFLLKEYQDKLSLSDEFFEICKEKKGLSKRYLINDCNSGKYVDEWCLIVPANIFDLKNGGNK